MITAAEINACTETVSSQLQYPKKVYMKTEVGVQFLKQTITLYK